MVLVIPADQLQYAISHARSAYPEECCGFLIGLNAEERRVNRTYAARNVAAPPKHRRYNIDPLELVRADEDARRSNLDLIGVYHSHPDAPVQPSQLDLEHAWPNFTYLVLSLQNGEPRDCAAWILIPDGTAFARDEILIV